jgi:hypothetical protein
MNFNIIFNRFFLIILIPMFYFSCQDEVQIKESKKVNSKFEITPISFPIFNSNERVNDHIRTLAYGVLSLTDTQSLYSNNIPGYLSEIENLLVGDNDEVTFERIENFINPSLFTSYGYSNPYPFKNAFFEAILLNSNYYISLSPRLGLQNLYDESALFGFRFNNTDFRTIIRIPEWSIEKNSLTRFSKPFVVVSYEEDINGIIELPIVGFKLNVNNYEVDTVLWQTVAEFEEDNRFYIWVVDYEPVPVSVNSPLDNCFGENAPKVNDGFCDIDCDENVTNSLNDCSNIRNVWIDEIEILEDYKKKCGSNFEWFESRLDGKFEIAYQSIVIHANGKVKSSGGRLEQVWQRSEIPMTKKVGLGCNFKTNGSNSQLKSGLTRYMAWREESPGIIEDNINNQSKAIVSNSYKPWRDTIYLVVYEFDTYRTNNSRDRIINVTYRPGKSKQIKYLSKNNEGAFGDKNITNSFVSYTSLPYSTSFNVPQGQVIMITPQSWPGQGLPNVASDELILTGVGSNNGQNANTWSLRVKLKYDL